MGGRLLEGPTMVTPKPRSHLNSHIGRPCRGRIFTSLTDRAPASASLKVVEPRLRPHHAVLIAPGLWLASPKNGNISNVGLRLSAISLPSCSNLEYRDGQ